jgi:hypothetical protein
LTNSKAAKKNSRVCVASNAHDYIAYINNLSSQDDYNKAVMFAGSAFNKRIWQKHPFKSDVPTFEDKEWSKRV